MDVPKPKLLEDRDVILKVTGSTVCGSDLHMVHGSIIQMQPGDILGHEFCGVIDEMGPGVKKFKKGDRVVASFQIACGEVCSITLVSGGLFADEAAVHVLQEETLVCV